MENAPLWEYVVILPPLGQELDANTGLEKPAGRNISVLFVFSLIKDGQLSQREFVAIMRKRMQRGLERPHDTGLVRMVDACWQCGKAQLIGALTIWSGRVVIFTIQFPGFFCSNWIKNYFYLFCTVKKQIFDFTGTEIVWIFWPITQCSAAFAGPRLGPAFPRTARPAWSRSAPGYTVHGWTTF